MGNPQYDWERIRMEYIMDEKATYKELSQKYGPARETLSRKGSREDWQGQRKQFQAQAAKKAITKASTYEAEIRARHIKICKGMLEKAIRRLMALSPDELSPKELRCYIKDACDIERKAAGIVDEQSVSITWEEIAEMTDEELQERAGGKK